jgi:hypothetical protein
MACVMNLSVALMHVVVLNVIMPSVVMVSDINMIIVFSNTHHNDIWPYDAQNNDTV